MRTILLCTFSMLFTQILLAQIPAEKKVLQDSITRKYLNRGAFLHHYLTQEWQDWIDLGLKEDSTIAYLWEMKAMPCWKTGKYEVALKYYEKAIQYNRKRSLGRQGYLRCIFQKNYHEAIKDMELAEKEFGYNYQNDHSYQFYIALCHLQLGAYEKARQVLQADFDRTTKARGPGSLHFLETFYMGIIYYELRDYDKAAEWLDKSLAVYTHFSDARYYKGLCLLKKGDKTNATLLMKEAKADFEKGYSITEDDAFYVTYPYQVNWYMAKWIIPGDKL